MKQYEGLYEDFLSGVASTDTVKYNVPATTQSNALFPSSTAPGEIRYAESVRLGSGLGQGSQGDERLEDWKTRDIKRNNVALHRRNEKNGWTSYGEIYRGEDYASLCIFPIFSILFPSQLQNSQNSGSV